MRFLAHRIADRRILRLIRKWLVAGVMEDGQHRQTETGSLQGAPVSPLLSNVYLHYVFDLWVQRWRRRQARGDMVVIRYADDTVLGFEHRFEAEQFLDDLKARVQEFGLELHPEKTRLIAFGRFANRWNQKRGRRKAETFNFLGFTHICSTSRAHDWFELRRTTIAKRMHAKLAELKISPWRAMHWTVPEAGRWLASVLRGYY